MDEFTRLLRELGVFFDQTLTPDENQSCLLQIDDELPLYLEVDSDENLLVGSLLGEVAAGRGREALFQVALRVNRQALPGQGIFAYTPQPNQLVLFERFPLRETTGKELFTWLQPLIKKGQEWQRAIRSGHVPTIGPPPTP